MAELIATNKHLVRRLKAIVGRKHVIANRNGMRRFVMGYRLGRGSATAVVRPATLVEMWRILNACVVHDAVIVMQAANTGLTGGSTPRNAGYDRPAVVVSTTRIKGIQLLPTGHQVICLPGATLHELERTLAPQGRAPHSVLGSSCIGASVVGGICNNSGGALVQRGPAYTEMSLYARIGGNGQLELINTLGIKLGRNPEEMLMNLQHQRYSESDITDDPNRLGSARDYKYRVRDISQATPARFNADASRLCGASGSAGKVAVFAVRVDSFPAETKERTFYIGTNEPAELTRFRRTMLTTAKQLPISAEYIHHEAFALADKYGKDTFIAINALGTENLPRLFAAKAWIDSCFTRIGFANAKFSDRVMQQLSHLFPDHLPSKMRLYHNRYEHHLILKVGEKGIEDARKRLSDIAKDGKLEFFECSKKEARAAFLHRFAVAGAAVRYRELTRNSSEGIVSVDVALPRNTSEWFEKLPADISKNIIAKAYYGHFFCHVFHQEYVVAKGKSLQEIEKLILATFAARGGRYPAEHNVGQHYRASKDLSKFYFSLDPSNRFNPGIGQTPAGRYWKKT